MIISIVLLVIAADVATLPGSATSRSGSSVLPLNQLRQASHVLIAE